MDVADRVVATLQTGSSMSPRRPNVLNNRFKTVFVLISDYFTTSEWVNFFNSCRYLRDLRDDPRIASHILERLLCYPIKPDLLRDIHCARKLAKIVLKSNQRNDVVSCYEKWFTLSKNMLLNGSGKLGMTEWDQKLNRSVEQEYLMGYQISATQRYRKTSFTAYYGDCSMGVQIDLTNPKHMHKMQLFNEGKGYFIAGVYIAPRTGTRRPSGGITVKAYIDNNNEDIKIFKDELNNEDVSDIDSTQNLDTWIHKFVVIDRASLATNQAGSEIAANGVKRFELSLWGPGKKSQNEKYGTRFSGAYIRFMLYPESMMSLQNIDMKE